MKLTEFDNSEISCIILHIQTSNSELFIFGLPIAIQDIENSTDVKVP